MQKKLHDIPSRQEGISLKKKKINELSRRERQVMEIIYHLGQATAAEVGEKLPDNPSYSAVRGMLRVLEERGLLRHRQDGPRYVYLPTVPRAKAMRAAVKSLLHTFFDNSTEQAVAALLEADADKLDEDQLDRIFKMIERARKEGR
jgi:BlaI family penicillinase repressor